jgi:hypothetical protein
MPSTVTFAPYGTTVSSISYTLQTDGFVQGVFIDSPALRYTLEGGVVASTQTAPIWGGLPLTLTVPALGSGGSSSGLGPVATTASAAGNIDAWCLNNQAAAGVITPSSNAPLFSSGGSLNFSRVGSGLLVVLPVNPAAVNTLVGAATNYPIYWNFAQNYVDITGTTPLGLQIYAVNTNSKTISYSSSTGFANWQTGGSVVVVRI